MKKFRVVSEGLWFKYKLQRRVCLFFWKDMGEAYTNKDDAEYWCKLLNDKTVRKAF